MIQLGVYRDVLNRQSFRKYLHNANMKTNFTIVKKYLDYEKNENIQNIHLAKEEKKNTQSKTTIINQAEKEKKIKKMKSKVPTNLLEKEEKKINQWETVDHKSEKKNMESQIYIYLLLEDKYVKVEKSLLADENLKRI